MNINENKNKFKSLVKEYIHRDGIDSLMEAIENSDFYTAPASTRFHGAEEGGLCAHSIAVGVQMKKLSEMYGDKYPMETIAIVALFHDLCKIGCYKTEMRNVKDDATGKWEKKPFYKFEEDFAFGGHGEKSVFLIMEHIKLTRDEAAAINTHMGFSASTNPASVGNVYDTNLLAWLLHVADEAATYVDKI